MRREEREGRKEKGHWGGGRVLGVVRGRRERFQQLPQDGSRSIIFNNCKTGSLDWPLVEF